jgi:hypothetical protein
MISKNGLGEIHLEVLGFRSTVLKLAQVEKTPTLSKLPRASWSLKLITPVTVKSKKITIFNQGGSVVQIPLLNGSGNFQMTTSSSVHAHVHLPIGGRSIEIQPYSDGHFTVAIDDLCISYQPLQIHVTVVSIANIVANIPELIERGRNVQCTVQFYDRTGTVLSDDVEGVPSLISRVIEGHVNVVPSAANDNDGIQYTVTGLVLERITQSNRILLWFIAGLEIGDVSIEFTAGNIRGVAHTHVFPPLRLIPPHSVILPGGVIKIGVIGGPPPPATIIFGRNSETMEIIGLFYSFIETTSGFNV